MRFPRLRSLAAVSVVALATIACTTPPSQEMSDARQAINSARNADAADYAPRSLGSAERLLDDAEVSLKQGQYDMARDEALEARQAAMKAREVAVAIADAQAAVDKAKANGGAFAEVERLVEEARSAGREGDESRAWELATEAQRRLN